MSLKIKNIYVCVCVLIIRFIKLNVSNHAVYELYTHFFLTININIIILEVAYKFN